MNLIVNIVHEEAENAGRQMAVTLGENGFRELFSSFGFYHLRPKSGSISLSGYLQLRDSDLESFDHSEVYASQNFVEPLEAIGATPSWYRPDNGLNFFAKIRSGQGNAVRLWYRESERSSSEGGYAGILHYVDEAIWKDSGLVVEAEQNYEISSSSQLTSTITYNRYEIDPTSRYVFIAGGSLFLDDYKYGIGSQWRIEEKLDIEFNERTYLTSGLVYAESDIIPKATVPGGADTSGDILSQAGVFEYYTVFGDADSLVQVNRAINLRYQTTGFFSELHHELDSHWSMVAGLRYDHDSRFDKNPISPRFALTYQKEQSGEGWGAKLIYTEAFVAPSPYAANGAFDNGAALNINNSSVAPEEGDSLELNLHWRSEQLSVEWSLFYNNQNELIVIGDVLSDVNIVTDPVYLSLTDINNTRTLSHTNNSGAFRSQGSEWAWRYVGGDGRVNLWGSISYVDLVSIRDGVESDVAGLSKWNLKLGATMGGGSLFGRPWSASVRWLWASTPDALNGSSSSISDAVANPSELNLHAKYQVADSLSLYTTLLNLTDEESAKSGFLTPILSDGRSVRIGMSWDY